MNFTFVFNTSWFEGFNRFAGISPWFHAVNSHCDYKHTVKPRCLVFVCVVGYLTSAPFVWHFYQDERICVKLFKVSPSIMTDTAYQNIRKLYTSVLSKKQVLHICTANKLELWCVHLVRFHRRFNFSVCTNLWHQTNIYTIILNADHLKVLSYESLSICHYPLLTHPSLTNFVPCVVQNQSCYTRNYWYSNK